MIDIPSLERKLNLLRKEFGLIGGRVHVTPLAKRDKRIEAEISLRHFNVAFRIDPDIDRIWGDDAAVQRYAKVAGVQDLLARTCRTILTHEIWHWKRDEYSGQIGCPTDLKYAAEILDAVYTVLDKKGLFKQMPDQKKRQELAASFANIAEDFFVNANLAHEKESDGLAIVYYDAGSARKAYQPPIEAFFRAQMRVWGKPYDKHILQTFYTCDKERSQHLDKVVDGMLKEMDIAKSSLYDTVTLFRQPAEWPRLAGIMTKYLSDLIEKPEEGAQSLQSGLGHGEQGQEQQQSGAPAEGDESGEQEPGEGGEEQEGEEGELRVPQVAESVDSRLTPDAEREMVAARYGKNAGPPSFMPLPRVLKFAYEHFAGPIQIKAKRRDEGFAMPIAPIRHEPFSLKEHDISEIDFSKAVIDPESVFPNAINFEVAADQYTTFQPYTKKNERLPDILFLVDGSGTMKEGTTRPLFNIEDAWGEGSKYHAALLGAFGAIKWLKEARIAPYLKYNAMLFSGSTRTSGWKGYQELEKAVELFWQPEFGGTHIDMDVLSPQLQVPPAVILFITDGGIFNWESIKSTFKRATDKHLLSYIQIKDKTQTGKDLASWGKPVYHIDKAADLDGLMIDLTKQSYARYST